MDLREELDAAFNTAETVEPTETQPVAVETPAEKADRTRDEAGRFAKTEAEKAAVVVQPVVEPLKAPAEVPVVSPRKAPSSWKAEAQTAWAKADRGEALTPDEVKLLVSEAERREGDFHKGIEGFKSHADQGRAYEKALAPYQSTLQSLKIDGVTAVGELLKVDSILRNAPPSVKMQKFLEVARDYGIDLSQQFSPDVARYEQELYQTKQELSEIRRRSEEFTNTSLNSEIERFKTAPGHEHFDTVRDDMAALLSGGRAETMDQAYEMAIYANPQARAQILEQDRKRIADETAHKRATTAAVSVRGSSPAAGKTASNGNESIRASLEAAMDQFS